MKQLLLAAVLLTAPVSTFAANSVPATLPTASALHQVRMQCHRNRRGQKVCRECKHGHCGRMHKM